MQSYRSLLWLNVALTAFVSACIVCVFPASGSAQDRVVTQALDLRPETVRELQSSIEKMRAEWQVPGLAVSVVYQNQVLMSQGFGVKKAGSSEAVDQHTLFAIASNSKAFTSAALAILVEEKKLQWDDRVQKYLPWFEIESPSASQDLRVRDLLCHRSGLGTFSGDLLWYGTPYSPREILERTRYLKMEGPFRAHYGYSNLMFLAAGEVIEKVSGMPWAEFVRRKILTPLEMKRTVCSTTELTQVGNYATPHKTFLDRSEPIDWVNWDSMAAAGGIISSVDDMTHWVRLQLRRGKLSQGNESLFSENASREMWEAHTPIKISGRASQRVPSTHFRAYGLGWALADYQGRKLVSHGGGYDGMYSHVLLVPEESLGIVVLTNSMTSIPETIASTILDRALRVPDRNLNQENRTNFINSRKEFRSRIDKQITPVAKDTRPSHPLEAYTGEFRCPLYGDASVELENGKLVFKLKPNSQLVADLEHLHYDTWVLRWRNKFAWFEEGTAHFVCDAKGVFTDIQLDVPNEDLWFHELKLKRIANDPQKK
ncbi:MAG: serine hydrolase [Pirellulales bacterium]